MKIFPTLLLLAILLVARVSRTQSAGSRVAPGVGAAPGIWRPANNTGLLMARPSEAWRPAGASTPQGLPVFQPGGTAGGPGLARRGGGPGLATGGYGSA